LTITEMVGVNDPLYMYLVVRRGALTSLARGCELAGAAAVACVRSFAHDERFAGDMAAWRQRSGKVTLRARGGQWSQLLAADAHVLAGDVDGEAVAGLPPRRRSARGELLGRMQAMTSPLALVPLDLRPQVGHMTYVVNPEVEMSSGKTLAQAAHAAVMAADSGDFEEWVAAGCPATVVRPTPEQFRRLRGSEKLAARVVDAGLTEVLAGTVTVLAHFDD
jgi:peptidyl-tRNA hydrolase